MSEYYDSQRYEPYLPHDRKFMEREGEPCRLCLYPLTEHYNGLCPKDSSQQGEQTCCQ